MQANDGTVRIEAPDTDVSSGLTLLPGSYLDVTRWMKKPCTARSGETVSRFVISGRDAVAATFDDWLPSPPVWFDETDMTLTAPMHGYIKLSD
ncbi:MAG: hypothetical protein GY749_37280 [Desulfobacteraceae bacterium]|nr:hypothetical protein [Desulfobacteraceae bacterium]